MDNNQTANTLDVSLLKTNYFNWLKEKVVFKQIDGAVEITTPLLDRHNDYLQIYALQQGDKIKLTDDGYIIDDLEMTGCDIDSSPKKREILNSILNGLGVQRGKNNELFLLTNHKNFPMRKHMLLQAMININDMFYTSRSNVQALFWEDVQNFLYDNNIVFIENISFVGKSGYNQKFDFVIPGTRSSGEKFISTVNNPTKSNISNLLFQWEDVKETRRSDSRLFAFLNDQDTKGINSLVQACQEYDVTPVLWTKKQDAVEMLSA
ncbi:DUF1829 domain-containing protein [Paenibacillus thiaminolyticus]|uniref:DUF1829 domain-containing protein n=1 Tax=Paenibacillus thiaminolyticus TaxID=49283 RepID=UPI001164283A|nr:DUF1829 domain-containing protein [Paenibacillus thiaminolyticus]NGP59867.1 DUF1829 domain-containing protein [Paenibacillus thiaminolyticus]